MGAGGRCASGNGCGWRGGEKRARRTTIRSSHRRAVYVRMRECYVETSGRGGRGSGLRRVRVKGGVGGVEGRVRGGEVTVTPLFLFYCVICRAVYVLCHTYTHAARYSLCLTLSSFSPPPFFPLPSGVYRFRPESLSTPPVQRCRSLQTSCSLVLGRTLKRPGEWLVAALSVAALL